MVVPLQHSRKCNQVNSDRNQNHSHLGWREELVSCAGVRKLKRGVRHNPVFIDGDGFMDVFTWQSLPHHILLRISAHSVLLRHDWHSLPFPFSSSPRSSLSLIDCSPLLFFFLQAFKYCQVSQTTPEGLANVSPALNVLAPFSASGIQFGYSL